ncbi:hypothetical protein JS541_10095 [Bifidobacterium sp. SO1]|nr:hypothetical protein [Bifidobacterium sp. SO1]
MGRTVVCNCNDHPARSEFTRFFLRHMTDWQLPRLIATSYQPDNGLLDFGVARLPV